MLHRLLALVPDMTEADGQDGTHGAFLMLGLIGRIVRACSRPSAASKSEGKPSSLKPIATPYPVEPAPEPALNGTHTTPGLDGGPGGCT